MKERAVGDWWGLANEVLPKDESLEEGTMTADQLEGRASEGGDGQATATGQWLRTNERLRNPWTNWNATRDCGSSAFMKTKSREGD
jgi:hypothetical protein